MKNILFALFAIATITLNAQDNTAFISRPDGGALNPKIYGDISLGANSSLKLLGDWTIEAWVKPEVNYGSAQIHVVETYSLNLADGGYVLRIANGKLRAYAMTSSSQPYATGKGIIPGGAWTHIAASFNETSGDMTFYINGGLDTTINMGAVDQYCNTSNLMVGARGDDQNINAVCHIDDVRIWDDVRTGTEIQDMMSTCLSGNESNLAAYYSVEGSDGATITDVSGNANTMNVANGDGDALFTGAFDCNGIYNDMEHFEINEFNLFPNPAHSILNIQSKSAIVSTEVFDITGKMVLSSPHKTINIESLNMGTYLVKVTTSNGSSTHKLVKE